MNALRDPRAESDWLVARFLGQRPGPVDSASADGLVATDCTGVIRRNDDLAKSCAWVPTVVTPGTTPLPSHEHADALASIDTHPALPLAA